MAQFFPQELAGHLDGQVSGPVGDLGECIVFCQADFMTSAGLFFFGRLAGLGDDRLTGGIGVATGFVQHAANFVGGFCQPALIRGQHPFGVFIGSLGRGDRVGDPLLSLVESVHDRLPGKFRQQAEESEEDDERPDGEIGLKRSRALEVLLRDPGRRIVADLRQMAVVAVPCVMACVGGIGMLGIGRRRRPGG